MAAVWIGLAIGVGLVAWWNFSPTMRRARAEESARIICPFCRTRGCVTARSTRRKRGISGAKATGAVFTGGLSMLATGLSRKESVTALACSNCGTRWDA